MPNTDQKTIISICPFQTQITITFPMGRGRIVSGAAPVPQILKVQCDRDKCQLWCAVSAVCAVSTLPSIPVAISHAPDGLSDALRDITEAIRDLGGIIATRIKKTP